MMKAVSLHVQHFDHINGPKIIRFVILGHVM